MRWHPNSACFPFRPIRSTKLVDPEDEDKLIRFEAPCYEMYGKDHKCPILQPVRDLYKEVEALKNAGDTQGAERLKKIAGQHWIKPIFYYQGFVIKPGMNEDEVPENPIRVFPMLKQVHQVIFSKLMSEEEDGFDRLPTGEFTIEDVNTLLHGDVPEDEIEHFIKKFDGINFILKKSKQGDHANYQTSSWAMQPTPLTDEQLEALDKYKLHDLRERLPKQPTDEQYEIMTEMVEVSIGRLMGNDDGYWRKEWKEAGMEPKRERGSVSKDKPASSARASSASKLRSQLAKATNEAEEQPEAEDDAPNASSKTMAKILKNRGAKAKAETPDADSTAKTAPTKSDLAARIRGGLKKQTQAEA